MSAGLLLETDRGACEAATIQRIWLVRSVWVRVLLGWGCGSCFVAVAMQA